MLNSVMFFYGLHPIVGEKALADAGISYSAVEQACVGYVYGETSNKKCLLCVLFRFHVMPTATHSTTNLILHVHVML